MDNNAFRNLSYGVYAVTTFDTANGRPTGCIANSAMQITSSPATLAVSINHNNFTNLVVSSSKTFVLNVLTENTPAELIGRFGFKSGRDNEKFKGLDYLDISGNPALKESCSYFICRVIDSMETATHTVFLAEVVDAAVLSNDKPMTYAYYHSVVKGKTSPNAPTHIKEEAKAETKPSGWQCSVCGYIHECETFPDGFTCPICGVEKDKFAKL